MKNANKVAAAVAASDVTPKEFVVGAHKVTESTQLKYVPNPKRKNSKAWARYEAYQSAHTFGEYRTLNTDKQQMADLKYDLAKGFVEII